MLEPFSEEELLKRGAIYFEDIETGFAQYRSLIVSGWEDQILLFLKKVLEMNGEDCSYMDFYFHVLLKRNQKKLLEQLSQEEQEAIRSLNTESMYIYFPLNAEVLPVIAKITAKEWLFSNFYFTKYKCTIWGNYGFKYPIFFEEEEIGLKYERLARECGLRVEYLTQRGYRTKKDSGIRRIK